jgi:hypothetical protein
MGIIELLGIAGSVSLLSGWRLYLTVFVTGLAMRLGWIALPENLAMLDVLANPWVLGISAIGAAAEFFADKLMWLDSLWDGLHSLVRPLGGALLALAVVDAADPAWQVVVFLLGGGAAFVGHGAKASARAVINTSPEPVSNIAVSTSEDIATGGLLLLAFTHPLIALTTTLLLTGLCAMILYRAGALLRRWFVRSKS